MAKYASISPWQDEYNTPALDQLRSPIKGDPKKAFDRMRSKAESLGPMTEDLKWFGHCWYWSITLTPDDQDEALAIIIPSPEDLQVASQFTHEFLEQLPTRRLKRFVRDGLELAMPPHDTTWAFWSIPTVTAVDDIMPVLKNKYAWMHRDGA
ncbi:MAG: hypothetical protein QGH76_08170 [Phycisphaerales bacterium]|jgi:hypothetical protein|nr:hypothetical protein [Phycisphaerales bacterium]